MTRDDDLLYRQKCLQEFSQKNNEPAWFATMRQNVENNLAQLAMPKVDKTNINSWHFNYNYVNAEKINSYSEKREIPEYIRQLLLEDSVSNNVFIQQDYTAVYENISDLADKQGVIFTSLETALQRHSSLVKKYYLKGDQLSVDENKLLALNAARQNGGLFLYVPKNVVVDEPLQALFLCSSACQSLYNHVVIVAEEGSKATYIERYMAESFDHLKNSNVNAVTEVYVHDNATVNIGSCDTLAGNMTSYFNRSGNVFAGGNLQWSLFCSNLGNTIYENLISLVGDYSTGNINLVTVGKKESIQNFTSKITHHGKHSTGNIEQRGVVYDKATVVFNGIGNILYDATKSDAQQTTKLLILGGKARVDANPILLIDEDDVTAGHAASVGKIDEMQMYYLLSRGISKQAALKLIVLGFLKGILPNLYVQEQMLVFLSEQD